MHRSAERSFQPNRVDNLNQRPCRTAAGGQFRFRLQQSINLLHGRFPEKLIVDERDLIAPDFQSPQNARRLLILIPGLEFVRVARRGTVLLCRADVAPSLLADLVVAFASDVIALCGNTAC